MSLDVAIQKIFSDKTDVRKFSNSNSDIAVTITYSEQGRTQTLVLDTVNSTNVRSTSALTQHPIVDGSMVADHMFEEPDQLSITGSFPLNGSKSQNIESTVEGSQLANIEDLFERVKREGIRCDIVKISGTDQQMRFLRRNNMVLTNISWTENVNTLDYQFGFVEAQTVEVKTITTGTVDEDVPNITYPSTLSFTESIIDTNYVTYTLYSYLYTTGLMTDKFVNYLQSLNSDAFKNIGFTTAQANAIVSVTKKSSSKFEQIVDKVLTFALAPVKILDLIFNKKSYTKKIYDEPTSSNIIEFGKMLANVAEAVEELNSVIHVYQLASDEDQECLVTIDNSYYSFIFKKNNISQDYSLSVYNFDKDPDGEKIAEIYDVESRAINSYNECLMSNALFRSSINRNYVHLVCNDDRSKLSNYAIVVSEINPEEFTNLLTEIIANAVTK